MTRIGLISDTHGWLDEKVFKHFKECDEIWHAGDVGDASLIEALKKNSGLLVKGVSGNIDGQDVRNIFPDQLVFNCENVKVMIRHIGGYPPRYNPETKQQLQLHHPLLFICGHSHILKVMYDDKINCLHMNPGAAGKQGWHKIRTIIRFAIDGANIKDCEVIELGSRSAIA
jgi:putative phosphoesterase